MTQNIAETILTKAKLTINEEAQALAKLAQSLGGEFVAAVEQIINCHGKIIVTGIGKSGLIGRKIAATLASTGTPSFFLHPAEAFHGDLGMISSDDVILALSYSGESDEVLKIVPFIESNGNVIIAMTGNSNSTLAKHSTIHLEVAVDAEACILKLAPTTSTTAQLAMGDALAVTLMQLRNFTSVDFARLHPGGSLGRRLLMRVKNVMQSDNLPIATPSTPIQDMVHLISEGRLGLVVICDGAQIVGVATDGDVRRAMISRQSEFFNLQAKDVATTSPITITGDQMLIAAEQLMTQNKVSSLLVTNDANTLVGVIQIYDIKL